jgi:hypothetical protein
MADVILVPVQGDATVTQVANSVQANWCDPNDVVTTLGLNQFGGLENAPSSLYVVGHGNWGLPAATACSPASRPVRFPVRNAATSSAWLAAEVSGHKASRIRVHSARPSARGRRTTISSADISRKHAPLQTPSAC